MLNPELNFLGHFKGFTIAYWYTPVSALLLIWNFEQQENKPMRQYEHRIALVNKSQWFPLKFLSNHQGSFLDLNEKHQKKKKGGGEKSADVVICVLLHKSSLSALKTYLSKQLIFHFKAIL